MNSQWNCTPLSKCLDKVIDYRGRTPKKLGREWASSGYRALSANNVKFSGLINLESISYADEDLYLEWMKEEIQRGDLLLTSEAPSGQVMLWDSDEKIVLSQRLFALRTNSEIDSKFLKYYLQSPFGQREIFRNNSGSTVSGISAKTFDNIKIHHPDKSNQKKIGNLFYLIDKKIECNNRINAELESMAKMLFDYWFVQFDFPNSTGQPYKSAGGKMLYNPTLKRDIPDSWRVSSIECLVDLIKGNVDPSTIDNETPYIGLEHIGRKTISIADWASAETALSDKTLFKKNDILFGKIRPYFHKVAVAPFDGITSTDTIILRAKNKVFFGFALQTIFSDEFVEAATQSSTGSKMPRADWNVLKKYKIAIPSDDLLTSFNSMFESILNKIHTSVAENKRLTQLRDWLLPLLMSGQVKLG